METGIAARLALALGGVIAGGLLALIYLPLPGAAAIADQLALPGFILGFLASGFLLAIGSVAATRPSVHD